MTELARGTSQNSENSQNFSAVDYATWLTKQQAADAIGVSTKTIEAFAKDQKIQQAAWRPQGRGAERAVYNPDDVARMVQERRGAPAPFVLPAGVTSPVTPGNGNGHHTPDVSIAHTRDVTPTGEDVLRLVFAAALQRLTADPTPPSENSEKLFLTIPEAAALSGLSQANLRRRCQSGWPAAIKDGAWKIRRRDLEAL
jgi:hypothetical protein